MSKESVEVIEYIDHSSGELVVMANGVEIRRIQCPFSINYY